MKRGIDPNDVVLALRSAPAGLTITGIEDRLQTRPAQRVELQAILQRLVRTGDVEKVDARHWRLKRRGATSIVGTLEITQRGFAFVRPDPAKSGRRAKDLRRDLFIPEDFIGSGMDGDIVSAEILFEDDRGHTGKVVDVLERAHRTIVGWYQGTMRGGEVHPRSRRINRTVRVPKPKEELGVRDFEWVVVQVDDYTDSPEPLRGRVIERIGADGDRGIDVLLVLRDRGITGEFPAAVQREAAALDVDWPAELARRRDLRAVPTLTIDPATAKDFDDALSIEALANGWRLSVHIADVAHFVRPGTALDREAIHRSTSVYPTDRVVPMLPERLSGDLCSLRPHEDRLAVTVEIDFDRDGNPVDSRAFDSVIHSDLRLSYEEVQELFEGRAPAELLARAEPLKDLIAGLRTLARRLRAVRMGRGSLDLDIPQVQVIFDAAGKVADLRFYPRLESHQLIEECMLAANEAVARELTRRQAPLLYRIHEVADEDRLAKLQPLLKAFGIRLDVSGGVDHHAIQKALHAAERHPAGHIARRLILRALKRAEYSPRNSGHFGLASPCYCHFTSPIRRYPDIVVHRQVKALANGEPPVYAPEGKEALEELGRHTSAREREAQEAEWEAVEIKSLEFMERFVGEEFEGLITSMVPHGLFVELSPHPVEGYLALASIRGDRFDLDELGVKMVGRRTGTVLRLGQKITVQIIRVSPLEREMELRWTGAPDDGRRERGHPHAFYRRKRGR
jgi:ribonuclease R